MGLLEEASLLEMDWGRGQWIPHATVGLICGGGGGDDRAGQGRVEMG